MVSREPPAPYRSVTPRMFVSDVEKAVEFLRNVFGAAAQIEPGRPTDVHIGNSVVLVSSTAQRGPFPSFLYVYVEDTDSTYQRACEPEPPVWRGRLTRPTAIGEPCSRTASATFTESPARFESAAEAAGSRRKSAKPWT